jgi:hypothetical protein
MQETIAVIFDFDDTLAPDTTSGYLAKHSVPPQDFWLLEVNPLYADDWDPVPAYLHKMIEASREGRIPLTKKSLSDWGAEAPLHLGVESIFRRLRAVVD